MGENWHLTGENKEKRDRQGSECDLRYYDEDEDEDEELRFTKRPDSC